MNFFNFLVKYLSNERLKNILNYYSINTSGTNKELVDRLVKNEKFEFDKLMKFFSKQELINLCKIFSVPYKGNKPELWNNFFTKTNISTDIVLVENNNNQIDQNKDDKIDSIVSSLEELFYKDIGNIVHRFVDYSSYSKEKAIELIKKKYPKEDEGQINEIFVYIYNAYADVKTVVKRNSDKYYDDWIMKIDRLPKNLFPFELEIHKKYPKIPKEWLLIMINFNFMYYFLK
ncbi:MAG: hypothetical protein HeimC3_29550 [Candidatus Heimdallarchaeota archaeon LC_3]|nr:MAG: hypothetical protein HeimC3_29550 [Candidatus Heimdallarchaeota archaeon LC_3]